MAKKKKPALDGMSKPAKQAKKPAPVEEVVVEEEAAEIIPETEATEQASADMTEPALFVEKRSYLRQLASVAGAFALVFVLLAAGFNLVYANKVYPGVSANGVYLGGLGRQAAIVAIEKQLEDYEAKVMRLTYGDSTLAINPTKLDTQYDIAASVDMALNYGRQGGLKQRLKDQVKALVGRPAKFSKFTFSDTKLTPYISQISSEVTEPIANASFDFSGQTARIRTANFGKRLDQGLLVMAFKQRLADMSNDDIAVPVYSMAPSISTDDLRPAQEQAERYLDGVLTLKMNTIEARATQADIVSWVKVSRTSDGRLEQIHRQTGFEATTGVVTVGLDDEKIKGYIAGLAKKVDQPGQNAALNIQDGRATVFRPSRDGFTLNQAKALEQIKEALAKPANARQLALEVKITKPDVTEDSLNSLGINELISEGVSMFPGSTRERMQNVRVGASKYNGVLLKPDEVFSFGALLGEVSAETGYAPAKVIVGNKQEYQYGGGLCQVSSTAYRAALNAGLPIVQRINHSFAVSYYTAPYGVPGVDATIYYPQVDFKFKNDTGHYILIQTIMSGTNLTFQFYGTKTKTGRIRGPQFISGSLNDKEPSHTVFYRDVLDLSGNVIKTDTVHTFYKSSDEFPTTPQFTG